MFSALTRPPPDPLWGLVATHRADPRPDAMELVVGVYRDAEGKTPVLDCVRAAEAALAEEGPSKIYRPLAGNPAFTKGMAHLLLGSSPIVRARQAVVQTVGGTGALRLLGDLIASLNRRARVWTTSPGYVNHAPIFGAAGLGIATYRWREGRDGLEIGLVLADLAHASRGDVVLLHGSCHNPTGVDPTLEHWRALSDLCAERGLIPLVDMAYQGFAADPETDVAGLRLMVDRLKTVLVAASCSKTMGLYCERVGAALVIGANEVVARDVQATLERIASRTCFMAPEHGAAVAARLLACPAPWFAELATMRERVTGLRRDLANAFAACDLPPEFQAVRRHRGLFSCLPLKPDAMRRLRTEHGVYGTDDGRINIAGVRSEDIGRLARAVEAVGARSGSRHVASLADLDRV